MPRTVRISPVPIPPPPVAPRARRRYDGLVGVALLVAAVVFGFGYVTLSGHGSHSYDRHASPAAHVRLTVGKQYLISTVDGPGVAPAGDLVCTYATDTVDGRPFSVTPENGDSRATHAVAKFVAPVSGEVAIACSGGTVGTRPVFVDDADDSPTDVAGLLLLCAVLCAVAGAGLLLGALHRRFDGPPGTPQPTRVSGVTGDPAA